jgi:hypothetical protein
MPPGRDGSGCRGQRAPLNIQLVPLCVTPCPQRWTSGVGIIEGHHLGQRVAPEVTKPGTEVPPSLADVCEGLVAYDTHTVDTRAGWESAERGGVEGRPKGTTGAGPCGSLAIDGKSVND